MFRMRRALINNDTRLQTRIDPTDRSEVIAAILMILDGLVFWGLVLFLRFAFGEQVLVYIHGAEVAGRTLLQLILTYYHLSRMFLFLTLDFIGQKLRMIISIMRRSMIRIKYREKHHPKLEKSSSGSPWSSQLPIDIMQSILQRLCVSDYFRCGLVCHYWQEIIKSNIRSCHLAPQVPWLMLCSHRFSNRDHCVLSPGDWKVHKFLRPSSNPVFYCTMNRMACFGSIEGWLIMMDSALWGPEDFMKPWSFYLQRPRNPVLKIECFFFNPISGDRVMLPSLQSTSPCHCSNRHGYSILKFAASSVPTDQSCFVVSLCKLGHLSFCWPTDQSWTSIVEGLGPFLDILIMGRKLYAATRQTSKFLVVFDIIQDANANGGPPTYSVDKFITSDPNTRPSYPRPSVDITATCGRSQRVEYYNGHDFVYLAKDSASMELFMIFHKTDFSYKTGPNTIRGGNFTIPPKTKGFRVFKLECNNTNRAPRWVEVGDLGDRILFVSRVSNKIISTNNCALSYYPHSEKLERNCIYFAFDNPCFASTSSGRDFGVFSLTYKSIKHFNFPESYSRALFPTRPVWFTPIPWLVS